MKQKLVDKIISKKDQLTMNNAKIKIVAKNKGRHRKYA